MPRPARSTGTSSGGFATRWPSVGADRGLDRVLVDGDRAGRLVHQHRGQLVQGGAERARSRYAHRACAVSRVLASG